jgi:hypothetical protein
VSEETLHGVGEVGAGEVVDGVDEGEHVWLMWWRIDGEGESM